MIPENVRAYILPVVKTHPACNTEKKGISQTTVDELWLPSQAEMFDSYSSGGIYRILFTDNESRIKKNVVYPSSSGTEWYMRSIFRNSYFSTVSHKGELGGVSAEYTKQVPLGFCT